MVGNIEYVTLMCGRCLSATDYCGEGEKVCGFHIHAIFHTHVDLYWLFGFPVNLAMVDV